MAIHDDYARITPYELALPDPDFAEEAFGRIRDAVDERSVARDDPGRFVAVPEVAEILEELKDPREDAEDGHQHGLLLYHAFHFREAGRPLYLLGTHAARYLVESDPVPEDDEPVAPPEPAGYVQLPRNLFWTRPGGDRPPEPVDGFFWTRTGEDRLAVIVVAGIREDRPGLSVVPLPPVPLADSPEWLRVRVREEGRDFESTLPGGEIDRLYSLEAMGEVLKLVARIFRHLEDVPGVVEAREPPSPDVAEEAEYAPRPTTLAYRRVGLESGEDGSAGEDDGGEDTGGEDARDQIDGEIEDGTDGKDDSA